MCKLSIIMAASCFLCTSFSNISEYPVELPSPTSASKEPEYFLYKTNHSYAIVGLGAITPGYILLIPNKHYETISQIGGEEWKDFLFLKSVISRHIRNFYGGVIFFEHGARSTCIIPSGACVDHAHLHSIPALDQRFEDEIPKEFTKSKLASIEELHNLSLNTDRYLFLENNIGEKFIYQSKNPIPSQFFRRIWAKLSGKSENFDFALFPEYQNMLATYKNFIIDYHPIEYT
jgi:diadenosine tetraphosphate (Ap4A) HIT family hydrolase